MLDYPGSSSTSALGVDGGNIVGDYDDDHGYLYDGETWTTLDFPNSSATDAYGIDGRNIVGRYFDSSGKQHGFVCTVPLPSAFLLGSIGLSLAGWRLRRCERKSER